MRNPITRVRDAILRWRRARGRVLFVGQAYYNCWYLSRELRKLGWVADLLNFDEDPSHAMYYHGEDVRFRSSTVLGVLHQFWFLLVALVRYDIFFFANAHGLRFGDIVPRAFGVFGASADTRLLRFFGKKIFYANNGCLDGVSQTSFSKWQPYSVCGSCPWRERPTSAATSGISAGQFRNSLADYQCNLGGNRADYNDDPRVHEAPWFYCLDKQLWTPDLLIPSNYLLPIARATVKLYHAVGNYDSRSHGAGKLETIKSTHIYLPLVERLKQEGLDVELIFFKDVPNKTIRYYQAQADIFVDMLTYGFFGANVREAMMLGIPSICFLRPEWLETMRREIPEYVAELPVVSATPDTVYEVLKDLVQNPAKRAEIGRRSRAFAEKWHASDVAAAHFDRIFHEVLGQRAESRDVV